MASEMMNRPKIRLHDPVAEEGVTQESLAKRPPSLDGMMIALLDNTKPLVDSLLGEVQELLQKDFPGARFRYFKKESVSGANARLMEELASCDVVVTGIGD